MRMLFISCGSAALSLTMFKKAMMVNFVMKRLLSALGLAALLKCASPVENDSSMVTDSANNPAAVQVWYSKQKEVKGTLVATELSTIDECHGNTIMYVTDSTNPTSSYAAFCFPYGHRDAQLDLLRYNLNQAFHCEGRLVEERKEGKDFPVLVEHPAQPSFEKIPLYTLSRIQVQHELPSHLELLPSLLMVKDMNLRQHSILCYPLSRYFVAFRESLVTICADQPPTEGLAHRIDYRKDESGQPTYRVE